MNSMICKRLSVALILFAVLSFPCNARSETRGVSLQVKTEEGQIINLYKNSYALVIGNGNYKKGWDPLPGTIRDAKDVARALERNGFNVTLKFDLTRDQFVRTFKDFITKYGKDPDNRLLFYYAGHGYTEKTTSDDENGYIVMVDASLPSRDEAGFALSAIDMQYVVSQAKMIKAKHVLFMFDSCFAGTILNFRDSLVPKAITDNVKYPVRQFITAGNANEPVPDRSVFKEAFLDVLEGRDRKPIQNDYLTGEELGFYLKNKVPEYNPSQHPQYGKIRDPRLDKGDFVFALTKAQKAVIPVPVVKPELADEDRQQLSREKEKIQQERQVLQEMRVLLDEKRKINEERRKLQQEEMSTQGPAVAVESQAVDMKEVEKKKAQDVKKPTKPKTKLTAKERRQLAAEQKRIEEEKRQLAAEQKRIEAEEQQRLAAEQKKAEEEKRRQALEKKRTAEGMKVAAYTQTPGAALPARKMSLRAEPDSSYSEGMLRSLIMQHNFFDNRLNPRGSFQSSLVDHGNGTVTDPSSGLMWQKEGSPYGLFYAYTKDYIETLNKDRYGGFSDWRLPTAEELVSLLRKKDGKRQMYIDPVFSSRQDACWTSDVSIYPNMVNSAEIWRVSFDEGSVAPSRTCIRPCPGMSAVRIGGGNEFQGSMYEMNYYVRAVRTRLESDGRQIDEEQQRRALEKKRVEEEKQRFAAEQKRAEEEKRRLASEKKRQADAMKVAAYTPPTPGAALPVRAISLRSEPDASCSEDMMRSLIKQYNIFDNRLNPRGSFKSSLVDHGDGTVTDPSSGLMWQKEGSPYGLFYAYTKDYIETLNKEKFAGFSDWRLPTAEELASLLRRKDGKGSMYIDPVFSSRQDACWTSDVSIYPNLVNSAEIWRVSFDEGYVAPSRTCIRPCPGMSINRIGGGNEFQGSMYEQNFYVRAVRMK